MKYKVTYCCVFTKEIEADDIDDAIQIAKEQDLSWDENYIGERDMEIDLINTE